MSPSQKRAALILQVRSGQLTATQAAEQLGISRESYYKWENRALQAMMQALEDRPPGRPSISQPDPEKLTLEKKVKELEKQLLVYEQKEKIRAELNKLEEPPHCGSSKKNPR